MKLDVLVTRLAKARKESLGTDYTIVCKGTQIPVHGVFLCVQSSIFKAAIAELSVESNGTYAIDDFPLCAVEGMIEYLYKGYYNVPWKDELCGTPDGPKDPLPFHEAMFAIGSKYQIEHLRVDARSQYISTLAQAEYDQVVSSLMRIYDATQEGGLSVHTILDKYTWRCIRLKIKRTTPRLQEFMKKYPEFAVDFVDSVLGDKQS